MVSHGYDPNIPGTRTVIPLAYLEHWEHIWDQNCDTSGTSGVLEEYQNCILT